MPADILPFPTPVTNLGYLYLDFNSFFASVEQQEQPHLRGKPVGVIPVDTDATSIIAASYPAKAFGIKTGTPVYEAKRLCPDIQLTLARHEVYVAYHHAILKVIHSVIPVSKVCSIDEVACALMRNEQSLEVALDIARKIKQQLQYCIGDCLTNSIGLAPNKYLAKVAAELQKPNGLTVLLPETIETVLAPLPVSTLPGVGKAMQVRLEQHKIKTIADLWQLSPKHMRSVWGNVWGERLWYLLRGYEIPEPETKRGSISHSHMLGPDKRPQEEAYLVLKRLLLKAATRLRRMEMDCSQLYISVTYINQQKYANECRFEAMHDNSCLVNRLYSLWKHRHDHRTPFRKVSVVLLGLTPQSQKQYSLLNTTTTIQQSQRQESLSLAIDKINERYGKDTLMPADLWKLRKSIASGSKVAFNRIPDIKEFHE